LRNVGNCSFVFFSFRFGGPELEGAVVLDDAPALGRDSERHCRDVLCKYLHLFVAECIRYAPYLTNEEEPHDNLTVVREAIHPESEESCDQTT